jgi:hypothetical protein
LSDGWIIELMQINRCRNQGQFRVTEPDDTEGDGRDRPRAPFRIAATLRDRSSNKFQVHLIDLSTSGFQAEAHPSLDPGAIVWLTIPGMQGLEATVMRRQRLIIGCRFNHPLHPAVFDHLIARQ